ncbi:MAG: hypothetical protein KF889_18350 [Alphaproteobacteria bacterium]|nr:hypothetical protein [Alphaproteobacteria bacterium]MCW5743971.1 hypothetical protein [Alphaproteobacteria bacterium]
MSELNDWPKCEACGGPNWHVRREPQISGFEDQFFTCAACGHVTERIVVMSDDDLTALRRAA